MHLLRSFLNQIVEEIKSKKSNQRTNPRRPSSPAGTRSTFLLQRVFKTDLHPAQEIDTFFKISHDG
jgi:hypothetical protein